MLSGCCGSARGGRSGGSGVRRLRRWWRGVAGRWAGGGAVVAAAGSRGAVQALAVAQPVVGEAEHGQAGEVDGCAEQREVGGDLGLAADAGAAAAVAVAHHVRLLALDLRARGLVVGLPGRIGLALAGGRQLVLVGTDGDRASALAGRAPSGERTAGAGGPEVRHLPVAAGTQRRDLPGRAGHAAGVQIDLEVVLREPAAGRGRRLHLAHDLRVGLFEHGQQGAGAIGAVSVDGQPGNVRAGSLALGGPGCIGRARPLWRSRGSGRVGLGLGRARSAASSASAAAASPTLPAVTAVATISSESGSTLTCPL